MLKQTKLKVEKLILLKLAAKASFHLPSHVRLYLRPIRCMLKSMNIEDFEIMRISMMFIST